MTDVLTNVLRSLRLRIGLLGRFDRRGDWTLDFGDLDKAVFHLIGRGPFWLHSRAYDEPIEVNEGDVLFFPQPQWHRFSGLRRQPARAKHDARATAQTHTVISCTVEFESCAFDPVLAALPPLLVGHCQDEIASAELAALVRLALSEYDAVTPGYEAMRERLAEALLIQLLRYTMRTATDLRGLLSALADPKLARALGAMHAAPGREWSVDDLAAKAGMSRSAFARRFGECLGTPPRQYLTAWRMHLAERMFTDHSQSVARIAAAMGYRSEAAFRHAFKRSRGVGPGRVRRTALAAQIAAASEQT